MQILVGVEKAFGPDAFETAAAAKNVGAAYKACSSFDDAETSYRKCISILQKIYGTEHPEVRPSTDLTTSAMVYSNALQLLYSIHLLVTNG